MKVAILSESEIDEVVAAGPSGEVPSGAPGLAEPPSAPGGAGPRAHGEEDQ